MTVTGRFEQMRDFIKKERSLFLLLVGLEAALFCFLIFGRRTPHGHDGLLYFYLQYYFLNSSVTSGQIPLWMPYLTHGTVGTFWYFLQAGFLQQIFLYTGKLFQNFDFITLFYSGIFFDELILLLGMWLLARRIFTSPLSWFFVSAAALGSCIWVDQPAWNFHFYYAVPLVIYFLHRFFDTSRCRYFLLAGHLLVMQMFGSIPYFIPAVTLVLFLYFSFYFLTHADALAKFLQTFRLNWAFLASLAMVLLLFFSMYFTLTMGTDQVVSIRIGRNADRTASLDNFLHFGASPNPLKWVEIFLGISPLLDYTLYFGIISFCFLVLGLWYGQKKNYLPFLLTALIIQIFSAATPLASFFYYVWPLMKYFRHTGYMCVLAKPFLCILSGFGFEALHANRLKPKWPIFGLGLLGLFLAWGLWIFSHDFWLFQKMINGISSQAVRFYGVYDKQMVAFRLGRTMTMALLASLLLFMIAFFNFKKWSGFLIGFVLFVHLLDLFGYKFSELKSKTIALDADQYDLVKFMPVPFKRNRDIDVSTNGPRDQFLKNLLVTLPEYGANLYGQLYSEITTFVYHDNLSVGAFRLDGWSRSIQILRVDEWLKPLDDYLKVYWRKVYGDSKDYGVSFFEYNLKFPEFSAAASKIAGLNGKIQFFRGACVFDSEEKMKAVMANDHYSGDIPLIFDSKIGGAGTETLCSDSELSKLDMRMSNDYRIVRFDSNDLDVEAAVPKNQTGQSQPWMLYSDVWHAFWKATVNGKPAEVYKTNLAYKSVKLEPGFNRIHLYVDCKPLSFLYGFFALNSFFWLCVVACLFWQMVMGYPFRNGDCK